MVTLGFWRFALQGALQRLVERCVGLLVLTQGGWSVDRRTQTATRPVCRLRLPALAVFVGGCCQDAFAAQLERQGFAWLGIGGYLYVGIRLSREVSWRVTRSGRGLERDRLGSDGDEMLQRIDALGIDIDAAGVGQRVDHFEAGFPGA